MQCQHSLIHETFFFLARRILFSISSSHLKSSYAKRLDRGRSRISELLYFLSAAAHAYGPRLAILQAIRSAPSDFNLLPLRFFASQLHCKPNTKCPMAMVAVTALQPCVPLTFPRVNRSSRSVSLHIYFAYYYFRCSSAATATSMREPEYHHISTRSPPRSSPNLQQIGSELD